MRSDIRTARSQGNISYNKQNEILELDVAQNKNLTLTGYCIR